MTTYLQLAISWLISSIPLHGEGEHGRPIKINVVGIARLRKGKISHPIVRNTNTKYAKVRPCPIGN
jgi:hypothetical protein